MTQENTAGELGEIIQKLQQNGLDANCTDQEKIIYIWRLYTKSEVDLKVALATVAELHEQQAEEMKEFENYVDHVRKLSAEREALTVEFAAENDQLKAENDEMRLELESYKNEETRDMLLQQGFDEIANRTISEQVAYLLVERARLMDELEAEEQRHLVETPDGLMSAEQLYKQLEQERQEFESELRQQHESMNLSIERLKSSHEEEISALVAENQHLQAMLNDIKCQLTSEPPTLKSAEEYQAANSKENAEVASLQGRVKDLERKNWGYKKELDELKLELQREKLRSKEQLDKYEEMLSQLRQERKEQQECMGDLQVKNQKLIAEKKSSELKMDFMEKEIEDLREQERNRINRQKSMSSGAGNMPTKDEILSLKKDKEDLEQQLEQVQISLKKEKQSAVDYEGLLNESEGEKRALHAKIKVLESQIMYLEEKPTSSNQNKYHEDDTESLNSTTIKLSLEEVMNEKTRLEQQLDEEKHHNSVLKAEIADIQRRMEKTDDVNGQLKKENDDLFKKLHASRNDYIQIEKALLHEKDRFKENNIEKDEQLKEAHAQMEKLRQQIHEITSELDNKDKQLVQLQSQLDKEKSETEHVKEVSEKQAASLREELEEALVENQKLKQDIAEKMKLLETLREEVAKVRAADGTLESSVPESDMTWFNKDMKKTLIQNKPEELYKKVAELETKNEELRQELNQTQLALSSAKIELAVLQKQSNGGYADDTEHKFLGLQRELIEAKIKLEYAERELSEMANVKEQLYKKQDEVIQLQNQLQEEKFNRSLAGIGSDDINNQLMTARQHEQKLQQRNTELQLKLQEVEAKLEAMNRQTQSSFREHADSEQSKRSLTEQVSSLNNDVDVLQRELVRLSDKYDQQLHRYNERRNKTKNKLQKARDLFNAERAKLINEVEHLQKELQLTKLTLKKELEWKDKIDAKYHTLLIEKRDLLYQLTEQDEVVRDHRRQLSVLQVRSRFLEEENNTLQQRVDSLTRQKQNLDRMIKNYQFEKHKEDLHRIVSLSAMALISPRNISGTRAHDLLQAAASHLGGSNDFSLNQSLETLLSPRTNSLVGQYDKKVTRSIPDVEEVKTENDDSIG